MPAIPSDPAAARAFAIVVVDRLRGAGHEALWAGGCVRDELLGRTPADYDVATSARPEQVRGVFGHRQTLAVGAAFGVITVLGRATQDRWRWRPSAATRPTPTAGIPPA